MGNYMPCYQLRRFRSNRRRFSRRSLALVLAFHASRVLDAGALGQGSGRLEMSGRGRAVTG